VLNPHVVSWLESYVPRLAGEVNEVTRAGISRALANGIAEGEAIPALQARVRDVFREATDYRAEMIARSETARASSRGDLEAWRQSGVVESKEWLLGPDPCEFCEAMAGEVAALDESFVAMGDTLAGAAGGEMTADYEDIDAPPLHPNCCVPGTRIVTIDGWRAIEDVCVGDQVLTHMGRYRSVTTTMTHQHRGDLVRLGRLQVTPEHPVLTDHGWVNAGDLCAADHVAVMEHAQDVSRSDLRPVAITQSHDIEAKGAQGGISRNPSGLANGGTPAVNVHEYIPVRDEEVGDVTADRILEGEGDTDGGQGVADGGFVESGVPAVSQGARLRHAPIIPLQVCIRNGYQGPVYNFAVADDESYIAEGVVVHNCVCSLVAHLVEGA